MPLTQNENRLSNACIAMAAIARLNELERRRVLAMNKLGVMPDLFDLGEYERLRGWYSSLGEDVRISLNDTILELCKEIKFADLHMIQGVRGLIQ